MPPLLIHCATRALGAQPICFISCRNGTSRHQTPQAPRSWLISTDPSSGSPFLPEPFFDLIGMAPQHCLISSNLCPERPTAQAVLASARTSNFMKMRGVRTLFAMAASVPLRKASIAHDVERTRNEKAKEH
jgi:hypothetical protein